MTILDANVLLYLYDETAPQHPSVRTWLSEQFAMREAIGLPWVSLWAFLRVSTNARISKTALSVQEAFQVIEEIQQMPGAVIVEPGPLHADILRRIAVASQTNGSRMTDAVLAALAMEHGAKLASTDLDFARFKDVTWVNPLD